MSYETGAAHTRIQNLKVENRIACEAAKTVTVSKAEQRSMQKVFFPDADAKVSEAGKKQLTVAFQILSAMKFQVREGA